MVLNYEILSDYLYVRTDNPHFLLIHSIQKLLRFFPKRTHCVSPFSSTEEEWMNATIQKPCTILHGAPVYQLNGILNVFDLFSLSQSTEFMEFISSSIVGSRSQRNPTSVVAPL